MSNAIDNTTNLLLASNANNPSAIPNSSNQDLQADINPWLDTGTDLWLQDMTSNSDNANAGSGKLDPLHKDTDLWLGDMTNDSQDANSGSGNQDLLHKATDLWLEDTTDGGLETVTPGHFTLPQDFVLDPECQDFASLPDNWFDGNNDLDNLIEED
ncbi:hypothetical protein B0H34DRAFT_173105 [Crassisporium funariophilum]|nr:hypothetical protein B0H34DRAFT_173105 [Crassisporium funariophilum]